MDRDSWHCTGDRNQDHPQEREMQKSKKAVWGGLTHSCEKKRSKMQGRKREIYPVHRQLPKLAQTLVHQVGDVIQPSHPLSSPSPAFSLSQHRAFSSESVLRIRWPKYWSFSISPSNEYSGLISFRIDWFDLLAAQGTLKSLLQHHSSKLSILRHSAFFIVQIIILKWFKYWLCCLWSTQ